MDAKTSDRIADLIEVSSRLLGENLRLQQENRIYRQQIDDLRAQLAAYWQTVEDVACGATIDCVVCGQSKPCKCDTK